MAKDSKGKERLTTASIADALGIIPQTPSQLTVNMVECIDARIPFGVLGRPGSAKTQITMQVAAQLKKRYVPERLNGKDPTDMGLPYTFKDAADRMRHGWTIPSFFQTVEDDLENGYPGGWLWHFDELAQAVPAMQNRIGEMLYEGTLNGVPIHPKVSIVWAANFAQDKAATYPIPKQIPNRSEVAIVIPNDEDFRRIMSQRERRPEIIAFSKVFPECLDSYDADSMVNCTSRTLEMVSILMDRNPSPDRELLQYSGLIGKGWAAQFTGFLRTYRDLPSVEEIVEKPKKTRIPHEDKTDQLCAVAAMLGRAINAKNAAPIIDYLLRLPHEFCVFAMRDAFRRDENLKTVKAYKDWAVDYGDVLT